MNKEPLRVREHEELTGLSKDEIEDLKDFALKNQTDKDDKYRPVLKLDKAGNLKAQNYVGVIQTRKGKVVEILPKIDLDEDDKDHERTKDIFLKMLRTYRGFKANLNDSGIRAIRHFNMLEVFVRLFLDKLVLLTKKGLARQYQAKEDNITCLRGRILFPQHLRHNLFDRTHFYVSYDELTTDRPANRLIKSTIKKLKGIVKQPYNKQLLHQLDLCFADVPPSTSLDSDWRRYRLDRSMQHYEAVMQWVGVFLFNHGLTTFAGKHLNQALLFPMEKVFEGFVAHHLRRHQHQRGWRVETQGPQWYLTKCMEGNKVFQMKPDISLMTPNGRDVEFILDTKWKRIGKTPNDSKHDISQADVYQLYSYGKRYGCRTVALIYPKTQKFTSPLDYQFLKNKDEQDSLNLLCFPFDVRKPEDSVTKILDELEGQKHLRRHKEAA